MGLYNFSKTKELKQFAQPSSVHTEKHKQHEFLVERKDTFKKIMFQRMREDGVDDPAIVQESSVIKALNQCTIGTFRELLDTLPLSKKKLTDLSNMFSLIEHAKVFKFHTHDGKEHVWLFDTIVAEDIGKPVPKLTLQEYIISLPGGGSYGSYQGWQKLLGSDFSENIVSA